MIKESAYSVKEYCLDAIIAIILGTLAVILMVIAVIASYKYDGNGPAAVGLLGIGSLILSTCGLRFSVSAWKSPDGGLLMKRIAFVENSIPLIAALVFYIIGWVL